MSIKTSLLVMTVLIFITLFVARQSTPETRANDLITIVLLMLLSLSVVATSRK